MMTWKYAAVLAVAFGLPGGVIAEGGDAAYNKDCDVARSIWADVKGSASEEALIAFLGMFETCPIYGALARTELAQLQGAETATQDAVPVDPVPEAGGEKAAHAENKRKNPGRLLVSEVPPLRETSADTPHWEPNYSDVEYDCLSVAAAPGQSPYIDGVFWSQLEDGPALMICSFAIEEANKRSDDEREKADVIAAYARALNKADNLAYSLEQAERAARLGNAMAMNLLGGFYRHDDYLTPDLEVSRAWYQAAADRGFALGHYNLGRFYQYGWGVEEDPARALEHYEMGADLNDAVSFEKLGLLYRDGVLVERDMQRAESYFIDASRGELPSAFRHLGVMYENGDGEFSNDYETVVKLYAIAAARGDLEGLHNLGSMIYHGKGVDSDRQEAKGIWLEAADLGHAASQRKYGRLAHEDGDRSTAIRYYRMAAEQGDDVAQRLLKEMGAD